MSATTNDNSKSEVALAALEQVIDPEIGLNIVDLGLIYQIDFDEKENKLYCTMTLTTHFCPMGESIVFSVQEALQTTFPDYEILVHLTFDPPWSHERISEKGKAFLNQ
ncbi:MAG: metal-sulfur cluster assembly factor [Saprospiraceae bacterium]|jgi:metal-sulfur cluster biosynthetic enzyme|nr:metal-sulfur cluster assembly factor [Saprospiraceae bacterium]